MHHTNKTKRDGTGDEVKSSPVVSLKRLSLKGEEAGASASAGAHGGASTSAPVIVGVETVDLRLTVLGADKPGPLSKKTRAGKEGGVDEALPTPSGSGRASPTSSGPPSPASSCMGSGRRSGSGRKRFAPTKGKKRSRKGGRQASPLESDGETVALSRQDSSLSISTSPPPRKRGRPMTTGEYAGLAAAKRELAEAEERALEAQADRELEEEKRSRREARELFLRNVTAREHLDRLDPADPRVEAARRRYLIREVEDAVKTVTGVARASKNLKGTAVKALRTAAQAISEASEELGALQATDEVRRLERDKLGQQVVIDQLRKELVEARPV